jgi:hypothetical protein
MHTTVRAFVAMRMRNAAAFCVARFDAGAAEQAVQGALS